MALTLAAMALVEALVEALAAMVCWLWKLGAQASHVPPSTHTHSHTLCEHRLAWWRRCGSCSGCQRHAYLSTEPLQQPLDYQGQSLLYL